MLPSIELLYAISSLFLTWFHFVIENKGRLTVAENLELLRTCGKESQSNTEFGGILLKVEGNVNARSYLVAISPRHIIVHPESKLLNFTYDKTQCIDNIQQFTIPKDQPWPGNLNRQNQAFYIGSCDYEEPRGFVVVEHHLDYPRKYIPQCLLDVPIKHNDEVEVFTTLNAAAHNLETFITKAHFCESGVPTEFCTRDLVTDFGGPVQNPYSEKKTYVGHAFKHDQKSIHFVPVYPYLQQICDVTGICTKKFKRLRRLDFHPPSGKLFAFAEPDSEAEIFENSMKRPKVSPAVKKSYQLEVVEVSDLEKKEMEVEIEEIEITDNDREYYRETDKYTFPMNDEEATESGENKVLIVFDSNDDLNQPDYEAIIASAVPERKVLVDVPEQSTIIRAEPFSAVIIPLPEQPNSSTEFSSPQELLIAFLIMLSLSFFVFIMIASVSKQEEVLSPRVDFDCKA